MEENNRKDKGSDFLGSCRTHISDLVQLCRENRKTAVAILIFAVVIVGGIWIGIGIRDTKATADAAAPVTEETVSTTNEENVQIPEDALEQDAYPEINQLITQYYGALAEGDMEALKQMKSETDEKEEIQITKKSEFIEGYPNVSVYTKKGPQEDSFVVYAHYEVKFMNYDSTAPGLNTFYVCKNGDGSYYINDGELEEGVVEYLKQISAQDDVVDLFNTVQVKYNEIKENDEALSAFLDNLPNLLSESVGEALAQMEAEQEAQQASAEPVEEEPEVVTVVTKVKTTDVVNVRSSDSIEADKIGKTAEGDVLVLLEEKMNGWSKVEFEGKEGFIKSEYLVPEETETLTASGEPIEAEDEETQEDTEAEDVSDAETTQGKVTDTINVRAKAGTDSDKVGTLYAGASIEIIENMSNGWSKILYEGEAAYVKTEFIE